MVSQPITLANHPEHKRRCPKCHGPVDRVRRRLIDRLVSMIRPVKRYRCHDMGRDCDWVGNLA